MSNDKWDFELDGKLDAEQGTKLPEGVEPPETTPEMGWITPEVVTVAIVSTVLVIASGLVQLTFGAYPLTIREAWQAVLDPAVIWNLDTLRAFVFQSTNPDVATGTLVVWDIRLPRVIAAVIVGANLAVSGAVFQSVTRNEMASPFILGINSGASLAIMLTLVVFTAFTPFLPLLAAAGGAVAFLIVYAIAWKGGTSPVRLVLAGVIVGTLMGSIQTALFFFAPDIDVILTALAWTTGSLTGAGWREIRLVFLLSVLSVGLTIIGARQLNVLMLGEETAGALGMSVERVRFALSGVAILSASSAIVVAGLVGFVGLIVPHMARNVVGSDYKQLIIACVFMGPALMAVSDMFARLMISPGQLPVGVLTGLIGGPYFLYLMRRRQKLGEL